MGDAWRPSLDVEADNISASGTVVWVSCRKEQETMLGYGCIYKAVVFSVVTSHLTSGITGGITGVLHQ